MRTDLYALREDAVKTIIRGVEEKNDFAINVGKRSLASYLVRNQGDPGAIVLLQDAAHYFVNIGDEVLATETYNELGNAHLLLGNTSLAVEYFHESLEIGKSSHDPTSSFLAEVNLAQAYLIKGDTTKAIGLLEDYKRRSMNLKKFEAVANSYVILGQISQNQGNKKLSDEYFEKSARYGLRSNARLIRAQALTNLAIVAFNENLKERAEKLFLEAFVLYSKVGSTIRIAESMFNNATLYLENNELTKAHSWYKRMLNYSLKHLLTQSMNDANDGIIQHHEKTNDLDGALKQMKQFVILKDSVSREREKLYAEDHELIRSLGIYKVIKDDNENVSWYKQWISWLLPIVLPVLLLTALLFYLRKVSSINSGEAEK